MRERTAEFLPHAAGVLGFPPDQRYNIDFRGSDHPDYIRWSAEVMERDPRIPRIFRPLGRVFRQEADRVEREMRRAGARRMT